ncbi:CHRD domain-containing protein [Zymomonas mobilis]|uniref:CHRD domain containing protein n=1 Tax=Zymomonas mobilis subsp. pomaceae (strain ATCC 29192 / DSM 22645 / JCM 10191 / CCUG 17912 / NBRC 13757 / NCIMB 11200 / NRRL B-4491 / Barker I) TaxID=579138 RepID=F8EUD2_ZYMMT|nr:CHRD domain-containing protein [Zymomonas mobilis]AEI38153.1 CHRD domain containing protein [Zymomonas mobilis subsp. pomaceae ATCC 29192]MDX5947841.1 CHRD domain-containing protein [Zymomonas mobilis subsp. pomaceae]GEB90051.1 CHRD domain-containing protein [Zymomonas mobilis subsp. pomaceae]
MKILRSILTASAVVSLFVAPAMAKTVQLFGPLTGEHNATSQPSGMIRATLNTNTNILRYHIRWNGLSGPVVAAHFHGPATETQDADVLVPISGPYKSPLSGAVTLNNQQVGQVQAGQVYVNLHTQRYPNGEARAQLTER